MMKHHLCLLIAVFMLSGADRLYANSAPVVSNVVVSQRGDDSRLVDIYYNLADTDGDACTVWVSVSDDGGTSWRVPVDNFSGAVGQSVSPGTNRHITWDAGEDMPGKSGTYKVRVFADDGNGPDSMVVVPAGSFAYQGDYNNRVNLPAFMIAKYETTVSQYCQFLNSADPDGIYWDSGQDIIKKGDSDNYYYEIKAGRDNYPVRYVSYNDAVAYTAWKSIFTGLTYRIPTEQEWEKTAGWDPVRQYLWVYAYQSNSASCTLMNYNDCVGNTRSVGYYNGVNPGTNDAKSYYGCYDMSGNLREWTSTNIGGIHMTRGGHWYGNIHQRVIYRSNCSYSPSTRTDTVGFRVVLDLN